MHNVITVSEEMELVTHLMPLLGSLLRTPSQNYLFTASQCLLFSFSLHFHAAEALLREQQVLLDPNTATLLLLFLTALPVRMTLTPATCSLYCGLFT